MPLGQQVLIILALCGWVCLWWLAVRVVAGRRFGFAEWVPVAMLAFGVPLLVADFLATHTDLSVGEYFLCSWVGIVVVIDGTWAFRKVIRYRREMR